jgi:glycosyltransferase involved in cell wall biosynthesis
MNPVGNSLPRLLYIGDVPVASTVAGSAQLYRLLHDYPVSHLRIVEGDIWTAPPETRLPNVVYEKFRVANKRLLHSRVASLFATYLYLTTSWRTLQLADTIRAFQPETILTVAHGFSWLNAAELASRKRIPLHLIVHDDWPRENHLPQSLKPWGEMKFARVYRKAASRLCVSSYMVQEYEKRYGVSGNVLYPCRAAEGFEFDPTPVEIKRANNAPVLGYFGSINSPAYARSLSTLAAVLEAANGVLIIYSALDEETLENFGLKRPNIVVRKYIPLEQLYSTLRKEVDALFVPMSFGAEDRSNMELSFPSKLTDYTATGLPILIWGPTYCSAVRWAEENKGVAVVVSDENIESLRIAIEKLCRDSSYRAGLVANAIAKGREYFSHRNVTQKFYQSIAH